MKEEEDIPSRAPSTSRVSFLPVALRNNALMFFSFPGIERTEVQSRIASGHLGMVIVEAKMRRGLVRMV